jgi:methylmalonyl-CoA mutase C-terminal domain/subunit
MNNLGEPMKKIKVLIAKPGLDGHERGAKVLCRALRDAGMEVIYTGLRQTPEQIVNTVLQEDVDCLGLSILSGAHIPLMQRITDLLKERELHPLVILGGIIPEEDYPILKNMQIAGIFGPGTPTQDIVKFISQQVQVCQT